MVLWWGGVWEMVWKGWKWGRRQDPVLGQLGMCRSVDEAAVGR